MKFTLTINGDTPAELLDALSQLGGTTNIVNNSPTPPPAVRHPAQAPLPQSEPVTRPDKPKAQTPAKPEKAVQKPAAAPAEVQANPTSAAAPNAGAAATTNAPAVPSAPAATATTPAAANGSAADPLTENKIRTKIMELMKLGKTPQCKAILDANGAKSISVIKPESYTAVWEQLCRLKDEVDADAAG